MKQWLETVYREHGVVAAIAVGLSVLAGIGVVALMGNVDFAKAVDLFMGLLR